MNPLRILWLTTMKSFAGIGFPSQIHADGKCGAEARTDVGR